MNAALDLLTLAREHGVDLCVEGGSIRLRAESEPPIDLVEQLREHKAALLELLSQPELPTLTPDEQGDVDDALADPGMEKRHQHVLKMLREHPEIERAWTSNGNLDPVRVALAVRNIGTCELTIAVDRWDPFEFTRLMDQSECNQ